jgi:hypothetical protein
LPGRAGPSFNLTDLLTFAADRQGQETDS